MNKTDLIAKLAERLDGDRATAVVAVNGVLEEIEGSVARGERVSLSGFGTFDRRERAPRTGRNPRTGETIQLDASVVPVFRAGTAFRAVVTDADGGSPTRQAPAVPRGGVVSAGAGDQSTSKDAKGKKAKGKDTKKTKDKDKDKKEKVRKTRKADAERAAEGNGGKRAGGKKSGKARD